MVGTERKSGNLLFTEGEGTHEEALASLDSILAAHSLRLHQGERTSGIFYVYSETTLSNEAWQAFAHELGRRIGVNAEDVTTSFPC